MRTVSSLNDKLIIEGTQQDLEKLHKALASVVASTAQESQTQVIGNTFNVIFRKCAPEATQGALDDIDDGA